MSNPLIYNKSTLWDHPLTKLLLLSVVVCYIYYLGVGDLKQGIMLSLLPIGLLCFGYLFMNPRTAFYFLFVYNYFAMGICRYIPAQWGLGVEALLGLIYIGLFFQSFREVVGFRKSLNELFLISVIWYLYSVFELFNPQADSRIAWFYGMRQVSFYFILLVPIVFVLFTKIRHIDILLRMWAIFSIFAVIKGWCQLYIGLDWAEQIWMNNGGYTTHMIWSGLRVFSIFTDAGQFGSSIGHSGVVFTLVAIGKNKRKEKLFYLVAALISFYGMFLSGTRGAIAVPAAGFVLFLVLAKNWKMMIIGGFLLLSVFVFLKYTSIGSGNTQIVRMRTSLNPQDESLQLRLENQAKFRIYMHDKPFGCGLGSTGSTGHQFFPNRLSSQIPTDSWFVAIWVEMGIVGLVLHLFILFYCLVRGAWIIMTRIKDRELYYIMAAFLCGYLGIIATSYGNEILGQMPTCLITYTTLTLVFMSEQIQSGVSDSANAKQEDNG